MGFTDNLNLQGAEGDLEALAKKLGAQVLGQVKDAAGAAWAEVPDEGKKILERASVRMGKLILRRTAGEDVTQPWPTWKRSSPTVSGQAQRSWCATSGALWLRWRRRRHRSQGQDSRLWRQAPWVA
jgi:hypothetical protein